MSIVIRKDGDGAPDDIVVDNCTVHIERMDVADWWIGITQGDTTIHVNLHGYAGRIDATVETIGSGI